MKIRPTQSSTRRAPNGAAAPRIQVALPDELLRRFLLDARANMRTLSAHCAWIVKQHYEAIPPR